MTNRQEFIVFDPFFFPVLAFAVFLLPIEWILGWLVAISVHESCHYIALCLLGVPVWRVRIGLYGAQMQTDTMPLWVEFICALAGPLGSATMLLFSRWLPYVAICACMHLVFNLLPIRTMDGGRMFYCFLSLFLSDETVEKIGKMINTVIYCLLISFFLFLLIKQYISVKITLPVLILLFHFISREKHLAKQQKK